MKGTTTTARTLRLAPFLALFAPERPACSRWVQLTVAGGVLVCGPRLQRFWLRVRPGGFYLVPAFDPISVLH